MTSGYLFREWQLDEECTAGELWETIYLRVKDNISPKHKRSIEFILANGSLASRILKGISKDYSVSNINRLYSELSTCLEKNSFYKPYNIIRYIFMKKKKKNAVNKLINVE